MMIVYVYPQSLVYGTIGPSSAIRVSHPLHEIIIRGLLLQVMPLKDTPTKRKKEKYQKKEKKTYNNFILIINNHQQ